MTAPVPADQPVARALALRAAALTRRERRWLVLQGPPATVLADARAVQVALDRHSPAGALATLWLTDRPDAAPNQANTIVLPPARAPALLGGEWDLLLFDGLAGSDPDALGATVGTLRAGGLLVLLLGDPAADAGRFDRRLRRLLAATPTPPMTPVAPPTPPLPAAAQPADGGPITTGPITTGPITTDQARAVAAVLALARGRPRRPLVLLADRGRGKSAALGLAVAGLPTSDHRRILVTAPRRAAVAALFRHAGPAAAGLTFLPPDALAAAIGPGDLVLVDEAAGIPAPLLTDCLTRALAANARIAFATTVQGYEGSGRGFALRFAPTLDRLAPGWRLLRLAAPVRWAAGDPLEALVNDLLLLAAEPAPDPLVQALDQARVTFARLDRDDLTGDEALLRQVFGLLGLAHYQTRPADLRHLLDAPNLAVAVLMADSLVLAVALVASEGGLPADLLGPVFAGQRRPPGHLLPLTLSAHGGLWQAPALRYARIVRIAVHPALTRRGWGHRLVNALAAEAAAAGCDLLGASFGATPALVGFWRRAGLAPVQLGTRRNAASGAHAAVVLRPLSAAGEALFQAARTGFVPRLAVHLPGLLAGLDPDLVAALLAGAPMPALSLGAAETRELASFADAHRPLEATLPLLEPLVRHRLAAALAAAGDDTGANHRPALAAALIRCVLQRVDPADAAAVLGVSGRAAVLARLRAGCRWLMGVAEGVAGADA